MTVIVKCKPVGDEQVLEFVQTEPGVRRKRKWRVVITYDTPQGQQTLVVAPKKKCHLADLSAAIEQAIRDDIAKTGNADNIQWTAEGR